MKQTYLVTGGAGFIGSHLCDSILARTEGSILCIDNFLTGNKSNIEHLLANDRFEFIEADVIEASLPEKKVDVIIHLASPASPPWYQRYPVETLLVNTIATHKLLEKAKSDGARFLYASTSEVYGDPLIHPQTEEYWGNVNSVGPRSCYDEAKRCGEAFVMAYIRKFSIDARIIRIFNTYGPRMDKDDGRVVSNFVTQAIEGKALTIYGDGNQTRSFCYVTDLVDGLISMVQNDAIQGEVINIGNPNEITVNDLAQIVAKQFNISVNTIYTDLPIDDPTRRKPSIEKAKRLLNWEPKVSIEDGLDKTIAYFKEIMK